MKNSFVTTLYAIFTLLIFNLLFWQETMGINLPIFSVLLIGFAFYLSSPLENYKSVSFAFTGVVFTSVTLCWHHTSLSVFMHFISVFLTLGALKHQRSTTVFESLVGYAMDYVTTPLSWYRAMKKREKGNKKVALTFSFIKLGLLPLLAFVMFFIIYKNANPRFDELTQSFMQSIAEIFKDFSFTRFLFLLFGFTFISVVIFQSYSKIGFINPTDELSRKRLKSKNKASSTAHLQTASYRDFKNEYFTALFIFALLNALLLVVNLIDINWVWFGFEVPLAFNLKSFVHEGTYLLIFSILLSMGIFLYFFRGNLNFYSKNKWLKYLGNIWIAQNVVLTISVFMRNYHYIDYHGLAGKRIGVVAFLLMTVVGLLSLIYKVNRLKTTSFLLRLNGWFIFFTLICMTAVNWDRMTAHYNLSHPNAGEIDVDYYLKLDETVAPLILQNLTIVEAQMQAHLDRPGKEVWLRYIDIEAFEEQLEYRLANYLKRKQEGGWTSWNYADSKLQKSTVLLPRQE